MYDIIKLKQKTMSTKFIAWGEEDRNNTKLLIINTNTGEVEKTIMLGGLQFPAEETHYCISKDGKYIAVDTPRMKADIFDLQTEDKILYSPLYTVNLPYNTRDKSFYLTVSNTLIVPVIGSIISVINIESQRRVNVLGLDRRHILSRSVTADEKGIFIVVIYDADDETGSSYELYRRGITEEEWANEEQTPLAELPERPEAITCSSCDNNIVFITYLETICVWNAKLKQPLVEFTTTPYVNFGSEPPLLSYNDTFLFVYGRHLINNKLSVNMYTKRDNSYDYDLTRIFDDQARRFLFFDINTAGSELVTVEKINEVTGVIMVWDTSSGEKILSTQKAPGKVAFIPGRRWVKPAKIDRGGEREEEEEESTTKRQKTSSDTCLKCMKEV